ncbi:PKD domain-containing protein [bacterium]|nr:PKD domain-containing protein [bacterium]
MRFTALVGLMLLVGLTACGGSTNLPDAGTTPPALQQAGTVLPAPSLAARQVTATSAQRLRRGSEYVVGLTANAGKQDDVTLQLEPEYNMVNEFSPAYAMFGYYLPGYAEGNQATVIFSDDQPLPVNGNTWLGLADWTEDGWRWFAVDTTVPVNNGAQPVANLPVADFISDKGQLLACLLGLGTTPIYVDGLLFGAEAGPVAVPTVTPSLTLNNNPVTLDGSASFSEFSTITAWDWDIDADGTYDLAGEQVAGLLFAAGEHDVMLRVTDDQGLNDEVSTHLIIIDANNLPAYVEIEDNDSLETAQPLPGLPFTDFLANLGPGGVYNGDSADWYRFDLLADAKLQMGMFFDHQTADLAMDLYDEFGSLVAIADSQTDNEYFELNLPAGRYYWLCRNATGSDETADYGLKILAPVYTEAPVAHLVAQPTALVQGQELNLLGNQSYDPDGAIVEYWWDLYGDGDFERMAAPASQSYTVNRVGSFTARLRVFDDSGAWGEDTVNFTVSGDQQYDEMEDNDTSAGAMALTWFPASGTPTFKGDIGPSGGFDGDLADVLSFQLNAAGQFQWILNTLDPEHGDLEIRLDYVEGNTITTIAQDDSGNDVLAIGAELTDTLGTYYMYIYPQAGGSRYDFSLHFTAN